MDEQQIRYEKLVALQKAGQDPFIETRFPKTHNSTQIKEGDNVSIAGRIVLMRVMGKASFAHIMDEQGRIQIYANEEIANYNDFKTFDLGDIVGVKGKGFITRTGELTIHASEIVLLAKALSPLPDKHGGLKDPEARFRERHLDLIANPEVRNIFIVRSRVISAIREFLDSNGFLEVETPVLQNLAGGANAKPFVTHHKALDMKMYLRIATELHLKRLIVGGFEKVYEIGRVFRNEGLSNRHNPEFTMLEFYRAYEDRAWLLDFTEALIKFVVKKVSGKEKIEYQGVSLDFSKPFKRMTMKESVGREVKNLYQVFEKEVEPTLIQPTFILDYPVEVAPLTKKKKGDPLFTELAELFIMGRETGNSYTEINCPLDQRARFSEQAKLRAKGDEEAQPMDEDFLSALSYGMPPTAGQGLGVDRLVMLLANVHSIRECLLFPTMRDQRDTGSGKLRS